MVGVVLICGGVFLLVDGGLRLNRCLSLGMFEWRLWTPEFWLVNVDRPGLGLSLNAHWFIRIAGGLGAALLGTKVLRVSAR